MASIAQIARNLDLAEIALREWVRLADIETGEDPPGSLNQAKREELVRLTRDELNPFPAFKSNIDYPLSLNWLILKISVHNSEGEFLNQTSSRFFINFDYFLKISARSGGRRPSLHKMRNGLVKPVQYRENGRQARRELWLKLKTP